MKDIVIFLGSTGVGKSTMLQAVTLGSNALTIKEIPVEGRNGRNNGRTRSVIDIRDEVR